MESENFKRININAKNKYISFMSPIKKNKKGHIRQMTKSIKNIPDDQITKILEDTDRLLEKFPDYSSDYEEFLKAKDTFDEQAIKWVFEGSDFLNKFNQSSIINVINKEIPIKDKNDKYLFPANLLIGASGSGKSTFAKQLIGSIETNFPATMQSNTTIGSFYAVVDSDSKELIATVQLLNESNLKERLGNVYIKVAKQILSDNKSIEETIYDGITNYDDKKVKLQYILPDLSIIKPEFVESIKTMTNELWEQFLEESKKNFDPEYTNNSSNEFFTELDEFIDDNKYQEKFADMIFEIIEDSVRKIITEFFNNFQQSDVNVEIKLIGTDKIKSLSKPEDINSVDYPKMISFKLKYNNGNTPDKELRRQFFEHLEYISSANENHKGKTLFPLVEHLRIKGNFKPIWYDDSEKIDNYILIDSEGIGHDITNQTISMEIRKIMSQSRAITIIQNGSEQMQTAFAGAIKTLIYNSWISKAKFLFNRMELFDSDAHGSENSKITFIKSNIKNVFKQIVREEKENDKHLVNGSEHTFEKKIEENSYYVEFLREILTIEEKNNYSFLPLDKKDTWEAIQQQPNLVDSVKKTISDGLCTKFSENFNPILHIEKYLKEIVKDPTTYKPEDIQLKNLNPQYRGDEYSAALNHVNKAFIDVFIGRINSYPWQTVKAFNSRIAQNWDGRGWHGLEPESIFISNINFYLQQYLINPKNLEKIKENGNESDFIMIIQQIIADELSDQIKTLAQQHIYNDLLDSCWKKAFGMSGYGSTEDRRILINEKITSKFEVDYKNGKPNFLYEDMVDLVFSNKFLKGLKFRYK